MSKLGLDVQLQGYEEAAKIYPRAKVNRAFSVALNKLASQSKTEASKVIREDFAIKAADIKRKLQVSNSRVINLQATIGVRDRSIGLINFNARFSRGRRVVTRPEYGRLETKTLKRASSKQGMTVRVTPGRTTTLSNAFIARGRQGLRLGVKTAQVWRRGSRGLIPLRVPSVAALFGREKTQKRITSLINTKWGRLFNHELDRVMGRGSFRG